MEACPMYDRSPRPKAGSRDQHSKDFYTAEQLFLSSPLSMERKRYLDSVNLKTMKDIKSFCLKETAQNSKLDRYPRICQRNKPAAYYYLNENWKNLEDAFIRHFPDKPLPQPVKANMHHNLRPPPGPPPIHLHSSAHYSNCQPANPTRMRQVVPRAHEIQPFQQNTPPPFQAHIVPQIVPPPQNLPMPILNSNEAAQDPAVKQKPQVAPISHQPERSEMPDMSNAKDSSFAGNDFDDMTSGMNEPSTSSDLLPYSIWNCGLNQGGSIDPWSDFYSF